jgi:LacI family transcriptional regulator
MNDVADLAGVSQTSVSLVLNNAPNANIPVETRERIMRAVAELGYRPNALAQSLRTSRTQLLGFISDEIATTPFAGNVIKGAQSAAWAKGRVLLVVNTENSPELEASAIERLLQHQVEGIIYAAMYHHSIRCPESLRHVPTVLVDCYCDDRSLPSVVPNEIQGGMAATRALLERGHRHIGFVNDITPVPAHFGRLEGYKRALQAYGVAFDPDLVVAHDPSAEGGYQAASQLLRSSHRPTGIFCFSDRMAMGAYEAARELGIRVPQDISIVGFDNQELISAALRPPLSTVALPHYEMGQWAITYLERRIEGEDGDPVQHTIDCSFVARESIAPPREA